MRPTCVNWNALSRKPPLTNRTIGKPTAAAQVTTIVILTIIIYLYIKCFHSLYPLQSGGDRACLQLPAALEWPTQEVNRLLLPLLFRRQLVRISAAQVHFFFKHFLSIDSNC